MLQPLCFDQAGVELGDGECVGGVGGPGRPRSSHSSFCEAGEPLTRLGQGVDVAGGACSHASNSTLEASQNPELDETF